MRHNQLRNNRAVAFMPFFCVTIAFMPLFALKPAEDTFYEVAAARGPAVTKGSFLAGAHRELSVALIKCQGSVYRGCASLMARAAGHQVSPGAEVAYED